MLVKNCKPNLVHVNGIKLLPGVNTVKPEAWAIARKHPIIAAKLEAGTLTEEMDADFAEEMGDEQADDAVADHLSELSLGEAKSLVNDTVDVKILKTWLKVEKRAKVKDALKKQIAKMEAEPEMRDRTQSRQIVTGRGPQTVNLKANPNASDD